jgi:hemolysin activation/secretion protein
MLNRDSSSPRVIGVLALLAAALLLSLRSVSDAFATTQPATESPAPRFDVLEFRVLGNTVLPNAAIERAVYPYLGPDRNFEDVEAARLGLEQAYRAAGFATVLVDIPEQQVEDGVVRLRVTEGRLDRVRITGARYFGNGAIRAAVPALQPGEVPNIPALQQQLADVNRATSDRQVVPVLKAGRSPGTLDVELKVDDELPLHASLELNNRYTSDTEPLRLNASVSYNNLFQRQHSLTFLYQTAPEDPNSTRAAIASYVFTVPSWTDTTFALFAVDSSTDVAAFGTLSVLGDGKIFGARAIYGLPQSERLAHSLTFGVDYKDFLEDIRLVEDPALVTPVQYVNWTVAYAGTLRTERASTGFDLGANFGIRNLFNSGDEFELKRFKAVPNYFYVRGGVEHLRTLPWSFAAFARLAGQFTQDALVSNEQYAIGGADTVRGYPEASALGDYGFSGTLEVRTAAPFQALGMGLNLGYVLLFFDTGIVAIVDPLPSQASQFDLTSWGAGFRVNDWHGVSLGLDWARVLTPSGDVLAGDERLLFFARYSF